jgi:hypothetical protein
VFTSKPVSVAPRKSKRRNVKEFFSLKMAMLSRACASREITAEEFRVLFALTIGHLSNETDWCQPKDETLGQSCATCTRSVGTHTRSLVAKGWITKKQTLHASKYEFPSITPCRQLPADMPESMSATQSIHVGKLEHSCRHTACRTEPSLEPSLKPSLVNGSALPSPCNSKAAASPEERASKEEPVAHEGQSSFSPPPPGSAPPPPPRQECASFLQNLSNDIRAKARDAQCRRSSTHAAKTLANMDAVKVMAAQAAVESELAQHPLYGVLLDWPDLELHLADATAAERKQKGSGAALIVNRYKKR